jgi:hypothetical protein
LFLKLNRYKKTAFWSSNGNFYIWLEDWPGNCIWEVHGMNLKNQIL